MKVRVIPTLLLRGTGLVKGRRFDAWRTIGSVTQAVNVYRARDVDELVFLDVGATPAGAGPDLITIEEVAEATTVPLAVGGGIRTVEQVADILRAGAEKVVLNTALHELPSFASSVADSFGSQSLVASIDVRRHEDGEPECFTACGSRATGRDPVSWAVELEQRGVGEILVTSIDRDGTMTGYDVDLIRSVTDAVKVPVIASGGAGTYEHLLEAVERAGAAAVAAASMFHFTEATPDGARQFLSSVGVSVRATWRP